MLCRLTLEYFTISVETWSGVVTLNFHDLGNFLSQQMPRYVVLTISGPDGGGADDQTNSCQLDTSYSMMPKLGDFHFLSSGHVLTNFSNIDQSGLLLMLFSD